jgi:hypothetical protein
MQQREVIPSGCVNWQKNKGEVALWHLVNDGLRSELEPVLCALFDARDHERRGVTMENLTK